MHISTVHRWIQPFRRVPRGRIKAYMATDIAIEARAPAALTSARDESDLRLGRCRTTDPSASRRDLPAATFNPRRAPHLPDRESASEPVGAAI